MNESNFLHLAGALLLALVYLYKAPMWINILLVVFGIEFSQAKEYGFPTMWHWFLKADTIYDILAGALAILLAYGLHKMLDIKKYRVL